MYKKKQYIESSVPSVVSDIHWGSGNVSASDKGVNSNEVSGLSIRNK